MANETPRGTATRTPLNGRTETLICLARKLRSIFMVPTLFNSTVFESTLNLTLRLFKILYRYIDPIIHDFIPLSIIIFRNTELQYKWS